MTALEISILNIILRRNVNKNKKTKTYGTQKSSSRSVKQMSILSRPDLAWLTKPRFTRLGHGLRQYSVIGALKIYIYGF